MDLSIVRSHHRPGHRLVAAERSVAGPVQDLVTIVPAEDSQAVEPLTNWNTLRKIKNRSHLYYVL